jgi:hypothetical protein
MIHKDILLMSNVARWSESDSLGISLLESQRTTAPLVLMHRSELHNGQVVTFNCAGAGEINAADGELAESDIEMLLFKTTRINTMAEIQGAAKILQALLRIRSVVSENDRVAKLTSESEKWGSPVKGNDSQIEATLLEWKYAA